MNDKTSREYYPVVLSSYVVLQKDNKILLTRRCNTGYRDGQYNFPAGHIENTEFATEAALREAKEEVGAIIKPEDLTEAHIMHRHCEDHERIDFFFIAQQWTGTITNVEPDKCDDIQWFSLDQLPKTMIPYMKSALEHIQNNHFFSEFTESDNAIFS